MLRRLLISSASVNKPDFDARLYEISRRLRRDRAAILASGAVRGVVERTRFLLESLELAIQDQWRMQRDAGSKSSKWRKDDNETTSLVGQGSLAKLQTQSYPDTGNGRHRI